MGVHGDFIAPEGGQQHDARGLLSHAGQLHQRFPRGRHFAAIFGHQRLAGGADVFGLHAIETAFADLLFQLFLGYQSKALRIRIPGEQPFGDHIDPPIGALCG